MSRQTRCSKRCAHYDRSGSGAIPRRCVPRRKGTSSCTSTRVASAALNTDTITNGPSLYCIQGIAFTPRGGQATVDGNDGGGTDAAQVSLGTTTGCPTGTQAMVNRGLHALTLRFPTARSRARVTLFASAGGISKTTTIEIG